jgi:hypothetical protein
MVPLALNGVLERAERPSEANPLNLIRIMPAEGLWAGFSKPLPPHPVNRRKT